MCAFTVLGFILGTILAIQLISAMVAVAARDGSSYRLSMVGRVPPPGANGEPLGEFGGLKAFLPNWLAFKNCLIDNDGNGVINIIYLILGIADTGMCFFIATMVRVKLEYMEYK